MNKVKNILVLQSWIEILVTVPGSRSRDFDLWVIYPTLILGSGPTFAALTMSSTLQIMVSLGVQHELFYALSIKNISQIRKI